MAHGYCNLVEKETWGRLLWPCLLVVIALHFTETAAKGNEEAGRYDYQPSDLGVRYNIICNIYLTCLT